MERGSEVWNEKNPTSMERGSKMGNGEAWEQRKSIVGVLMGKYVSMASEM